MTMASALLAFALAPQITRLLVPGYSLALQALTTDLMRIMLMTPIIFGLSGISMAILNTHEHFLLPALAPVLYNLSIIAGAALLAPHWGVYGLAVGVVAGALLHLLVQIPGLSRRGWAWTATLGLHDAGVREVVRLLLPRMLGLAVIQVNFFVSVRLASGLSESSLPALNYAFLLMMLPQGIFAMAIATAAFPSFSDLAARKLTSELCATLTATLRAMIFLSVPAAVGLLVLRGPLIRVLLQRGQFTDGSTQAVAWALQFYVLGLPAYAVVEILSRAFYALHDTKTPVVVAAVTVALNIILSLLLIERLDIGGLALANALAVNVEMLCLLWFMDRRLELDRRALLKATIRILGAAMAMGGILMGCLRAMSGQSPWWVALVSLLVGGGSYLGAAWLLRLDEVRILGQVIANRVRPGQAAGSTGL